MLDALQSSKHWDGMRWAALREEEFANSNFHYSTGGGKQDQLEFPKWVCCSVADNGLILSFPIMMHSWKG